MPNKRGKQYDKPSWKNQYSEHDFRANNSRRVHFKTGGSRREHPKDWTSSVRQHLLDEDVDMGISSTSNIRSINYKKNFIRKGSGRSGSPAPHLQAKRKLHESPSGWFRITMPHGSKYGKEFIYKTLSEKVNPLHFWPVQWETNGTVAIFYVDDFKLADRLHHLDRVIQMPDGYRLLVKVYSGTPTVEASSEMKEKIKLTMAKRYNAAMKALDLTKFHADPDLQDYFCALSKPTVFSAVVEIIAENIRDMEAICLDDNKLHTLFNAKKFADSMPNLKILRIAQNKIRELTILDPLSSLPVVDLVLDGNPVCGKFKEQSMYISEVRKRFPKVIKLDGVDLDPPISFDLEDNVKLPPCQQTYLCNSEGHTIVRQFLEQYFQIYDTDNREPLLQAYHQQAMFSMTTAYPYGQQKEKNVAWLSWYLTDNRNLLKVEDPTRRQKLLKFGHLNIIAFLQAIPKTRHDIQSFTVDLSLFTPQMLCLTVGGIFRELKSGHKQPPLRYFHRTLVIVPAGSGFCIANETLHITNCTDSQAKNAFKIPVPAVVVQAATPVTSPNTSLTEVPQVPNPVVALPVVPDQNIQVQMVQALASQTGMNLEYSKKCLEESQWNFETAIIVFTQAHKQGIIPAEAFANK